MLHRCGLAIGHQDASGAGWTRGYTTRDLRRAASAAFLGHRSVSDWGAVLSTRSANIRSFRNRSISALSPPAGYLGHRRRLTFQMSPRAL